MTAPPTREPRPPRPAWRLLALALPEDVREHVLGDLHEVFLLRCASHGRVRAGLWYWGQALSCAFAFLRERLREGRERGKSPEGITASSRARRGRLLDRAPNAARAHEARSEQVLNTLEGWIRDFGHAARSLLRARSFTVVTVATLALAIGANTAIFSIVHAVLLDALPFHEPERLVSIRGSAPGSDLPEEFGIPDELYVEYLRSADRLAEAGLYGVGQSTARSGENVERLFMSRMTPSVFTTLGVRPALGRLPTEADDDADTVVLSHRLWTSWFGADPGVLGRSLEALGAVRTVIGVMGPEFSFPDERVALWVPWRVDPEQVEPGGFGGGLVGRMSPGTDHASLAAQLEPLARRLPERFGGSANYARIMERLRPVVRPLQEELIGDVAGPLWVLLGTVGIILLIACANVANLFLARTQRRRRDLAVRQALGAGRAGLIRAQMAEALLLAALGGAGGALLAWVGVPLLVRAAPASIAGGWSSGPIPRLAAVDVDLTALAFTAAVSILTACAFGLAPAIRFSRPGLAGGLRHSRGTSAEAGRRGRDALVVVQTASALVLLVAAGLLVRSFSELSRVDPGYDTEDIFTFQIAPTSEDLIDGPTYARFHHAFMERLAALPGVESVGVVATLPLDEGAGEGFFATERTQASGAEEPLLRHTFASGSYFSTMGIEPLAGRVFDLTDEATGVASAIVSRSAADLLWPGEDPLGQHLKPSGAPMWWSVVGVVEDVLLDDFRRQSPEPMVYFPLVGPTADLYAIGSPAYVVKSDRADVLAPEVRDLVREAAPESPMYRVFTMEELAARSMAQLSFTMLLLGVAAGLALILGAVGLYGILSYVVSQRTREIGIRMALGARARELRRMVVLQGGRVALLGVAVGVLAALGVTRVLERLLFGVEAVDAPTFAAMSGVMIVVALLASYIPARRASSVDPLQSLRAE